MSISLNITVPKKIFTEIEKNIIFLTRDDIIKIDSFKEFHFEKYNLLINSKLREKCQEHLNTGKIIKDFTPKLKKQNTETSLLMKFIKIFYCFYVVLE
jgi:hypothetical protein